jgi:hypothetical protein
MVSKAKVIIAGVVVALSTAGLAQAEQLHAPPTAGEVRTRTLTWVAGQKGIDKATLERAGKVWALGEEKLSTRELFAKVVETFTIADPKSRTFVGSCALMRAPLLPPKPTALEGDGVDKFYAANMGLYYGRYLAQRKMFDEALRVFRKVDVAQSVDPASYLFFKACCEHQLLLKEDGLKTIGTLLRNTEGVPARYSTVATLMEVELKGLQLDSLNAASRLMKDSERRLDLARGGRKVQKVQDEIVTILDDIIEKLEQQGGT